MTVEDIIKFYEDETNLYTFEDDDDFRDIAHVKDVSKASDNVKTKAKTLKAQSVECFFVPGGNLTLHWRTPCLAFLGVRWLLPGVTRSYKCVCDES
jgi:hypothetical protein